MSTTVGSEQTPVGDAAVFAAPIQIEFRGHVGSFWSDDLRRSFAECSCGGWALTSRVRPHLDAMDVLERWREHYEDVSW